ncbi:PLP-dependent cysteine synthase family protein [Microbispora sp. H10836]|uniref:PLP-dependent cysteine synthase family protein n=1 Tax=Microbispora sp. H10836 TaxID=2729106 RepID=UPI00147572AE|nr:PLP-dependent cysteine synthase family protein [Microbispora sp. H10836]
MNHLDRHDPVTRAWVADAIQAVEADANRSCDTHLHAFPLPSHWGVDLYLKDESVHPTGSLKHRLARSLFLYGLANGWIGPSTTIIEASSGSTAVSEAYFARLLGLPFIAVIPASTSPEKREIIEFYGGKCHLVDDPRAIYDESHRLAVETGGHYMDQFTYAERATDWRGNNNIAESIFQQMTLERHPEPAWIVVGAGTGGTSATIGRYIRYRRHQTRLCVADPEGSAFFPSWVSGEEHGGAGSRIEGIGRPRVEPSFLPTVIDRMTQVPDALSIAAMHWVREVTRREVGGSTGTNIAAAVQIIREMRQRGEHGSVVTLICDGAERYRDTYGDPRWLSGQDIDIAPHLEELRAFLRD